MSKILKSSIYSTNYRKNVEGVSKQKELNNIKFVKACADTLSKPRFRYSGNILYLDGEQSRTTQKLLSNTNIPRDRLIPISKDPFAYNQFLRYVPRKNALNDTISSVLDNNNISMPLAAIWLDYCGTIDGTKKSRDTNTDPISDIHRILDHTRTGTVFAVTFCRRGNPKTPYRSKEYIEQCINDILNKKGYQPNMKIINYNPCLMLFGITTLKNA